jgi:TrmH family RNA methyltransferase
VPPFFVFEETMTETITSTHNQRLRELRKLQDRKHRDRTGLFAAEGEDMVHQALAQGTPPEAVFFDAGALAPSDPPLSELGEDVELVPVDRDALAASAALASGARVIGVWRQRWTDLSSVAACMTAPASGGEPAATHTALYLHEVSDPGNVGTVVRAALGFGAAAVILSPGSADPFGPKAVRAAMGSLFGRPIVRASFDDARQALVPHEGAVALVPGGGRALHELGSHPARLFVLGAERHGLSDEIVARCDETAHIALAPGGVDSLNVAMAATLCLYQASLHRLSPTDA